MGLSHGGRTYAVLRARAAKLEVVTGHLPDAVDGRPVRRRRFTDDDLRRAVATSESVAAVMRELGYEPSGGMHRFIRAHIKRLELDTTHFVGQAWARGRKLSTGFRRRPIEEILVNGSSIGGSALLRRLIAEGLREARCDACGRTEWEGQPIPLELDHVNGDPTDNRLDNLRPLCPNCHALTETYCGRKRARRRSPMAEAQVLGT